MFSVSASDGSLTEVPLSPFPTGERPVGIAVHPDGRFLYVVNASNSTVSAHEVDPSTGRVTLLGAFPTGLAGSSVYVEPTGRFVYVTSELENGLPDDVTSYTIDRNTGLLSNRSDVISNGEARATVATP